MTTASKLVAALCMVFVAYWVTGIALPEIPEQYQPRGVGRVNILLGFYFGWTVMGKFISRGLNGAINATATTSIILFVVAIFVHSFRLMITHARRVWYDDAIEALADVFSLAIELTGEVLTTEFVISYLGGTFVAALITQFAARRWR